MIILYLVFNQENLKARGEALTSKLQLQYQRSATENALLSSQLGSSELLKLTGLPGRLIVALFEHGSVIERMKNPAEQTYPGEDSCVPLSQHFLRYYFMNGLHTVYACARYPQRGQRDRFHQWGGFSKNPECSFGEVAV